MSHTTHHPRHTRPTRRTSRYLLAFASAAFITGAIAIPASAATTPTAPTLTAGILTDTPGTNDDGTFHYDQNDLDFPGGSLFGGASGGNDDTTEYGSYAGDNPYRDPAGGAYGPDTCKQGYVWRESFDGDTHCVTPAERDVAMGAG